jgi:hypothetical protein
MRHELMSNAPTPDIASGETPRSSHPPERRDVDVGGADPAWDAVMAGPMSKEPMTADEQRAFDEFWSSRA